ncbi:MAG: AbrB/MazE/SpoVT family DNA-binding domain-containing protein [Candidatus Bathyarchaeota archaeon]
MSNKMEKNVNNVLRDEMMLDDRKAGITFTVYMRQEGRVTVPKELRDAYDLKEGDLVECKIRKIK